MITILKNFEVIENTYFSTYIFYLRSRFLFTVAAYNFESNVSYHKSQVINETCIIWYKRGQLAGIYFPAPKTVEDVEHTVNKINRDLQITRPILWPKSYVANVTSTHFHPLFDSTTKCVFMKFYRNS